MNKKVFIGNYTNKGICIVELNDEFKIINREYLRDLPNNSYLCKNNTSLYTVIEFSKNPKYNSGYVVSYNVLNGLNKLINKKSSYGKGPCYLTIDNYRQILYVANYGGGSISAFKIAPDGKIGKKLLNIRFNKQSRIHHIKLTSNFKQLFVTDLGMDELIEYNIEYKDDKLELKESSKIKFLRFAKPRHIAIDNYDNIYVITEDSCELYKIGHNKQNKLEILEKKTILPANEIIHKNYTGCAIKIDRKFEYLYLSVRGHNSISVFDIKYNKLKFIQNISCYGSNPRDIELNDDKLFCTNVESNNVSIFNVKNGKLNYLTDFKTQLPTCIVVD